MDFLYAHRMQLYRRNQRRAALLVCLALFLCILFDARAVLAAQSAVEIDGLSGTYQQPEVAGTTAAIIVAGSGPTDRNGNNNFGLKTDAYRMLAQVLEQAGIASLRFDKRGVAGSAARVSSEEALTIEQFADDVVKLALWLRENKSIREVVLIGHSEGGVVALLAAERVKPKSIILLASPGRPLAALIREQLNQVAVPDQVRAKALPILATLERGELVNSVPDELMGLFRPSIQGFLRSLMKIDPAVLLAASTAKLLVVGGAKDVQVTRNDFDALLKVRPSAESSWIADMTHALKLLPQGALQQRTYTDPSLLLAPELARVLSDFLKRN